MDNGPWVRATGCDYPEPETSRAEALQRVIEHRAISFESTPDDKLFDQALRCALTQMMTGEVCTAVGI